MKDSDPQSRPAWHDSILAIVVSIGAAAYGGCFLVVALLNRAYGLSVVNCLFFLASLWAITRILRRRRHASRGTPPATTTETPTGSKLEQLRMWLLTLTFAGVGVFAIWDGLQKEGSSGVVPILLGVVMLVSVCGIVYRWFRYIRSS